MGFYARTLFGLLTVSLLFRSLSAQVYNLSLSIEEGLPARTIIGDIKAALPEQIHTTGFFISESRDSDVFRDLEIDGGTGIISTAVVLDRESRDKYEFAAATLTGEVIKIRIVVKDVNDHSPVFPRETVQLNVSELSPPGTRFELEGAQDRDEGENGIQGYRITDQAMGELFKVEVHSGRGGEFTLDLVLLERLDREAEDSYNITIEAFDGGVPPKKGLLQVLVSVLDENDNPPVFNETEYRAVVWENAPALTSVCQVYATDLDLGFNALVTYEINRRQSDPNEFFTIDKTTGVIRVNKPLDFESQSFFELIVTAWDNGIQPESSSTFVGVRVLDVNDNSPAISVLFLNPPDPSGAAQVSEGAEVGEYVARVSVTDPDLGEVNKVNVSLQGGEGKFALTPTDDFLFALCVDGPLDREEKELYQLTVVASDLGSPPLRSETLLLVKITDLNDNAPVFEQDSYVARVREDVPQGSAVLQVRARDRDEGVNSHLRYSILPSDQNHLVVMDPETGFITTATSLDHEREAEVWALVVAIDGGSPPLSSTATVTIQIEDINDNRPAFTKQLYNVSIQEHSAVGTCFLQVSAVDADSGDFGTVSYSLADSFRGDDDHPHFRVDPVSGEICVSQDIDREAGLVTFDLSVKAEDQGGLSSQTYIHIEVEDMNDNVPEFNPETYICSISEHAQSGTEILNVIATDRDSGSYGRITYEILPGDSSSLFSVDQSTGTVYLTSSLTELGSSSVKLSVSARDGGGRSVLRPADVTVNILHSAQTPAVFHRAHYSFSVPEDAPAGTSVGIVQAANPANSVESVSYRISSGNPQGLFSVDTQSGLITVSADLDRESQSYVLLTVQSQTGTVPVYSTTRVNVSLTDINDNPPAFSQSSDHISVSRNTPPGTLLFIAHAHDPDNSTNGTISYTLHPDSQIFTLHPHLGTLTLNGSLSQDTRPRHVLEIVASDGGSPPLSSTLTLTVQVEPSGGGGGSLAFETLLYQVEIGESAQRDTRVIQVRAHGARPHRGDLVDSTPPVLTYSLEPLSTPPPVLIHPESGWLFLSENLDYEMVPTYRFRVLATARDDKSALVATATVVVMVQDENDNAPVFCRDVYFLSMSEGPTPQGLVGTVKATDKDSRQNAQLSYILLSDTRHFRINAKTGEIINWVAVDREDRPHHTLRVMVTDQGRPRLNSTATVHIQVTDINDNTPHFTHLPATKELSVQVWPGLPTGSVVTSMFAKDLDAGENGAVTFTLSADDDFGHFEIDRRSGDIRTTARFSSNPQKHYTLTVVATDNGHIPLEESAIVHVQLQHLERQTGLPEFLGLRHFTVREDARLGTVIGSLKVPGGDGSRRLRYSIVEGDGSLHFGVDGVSGDLYVAQRLDYEATQRYSLVVRAEATPTVNATALVAVTVEDVNDHAPWFPGDQSVLMFGLSEDVAVGTAVYTFNARDGDASLRHSALRYSLTSDPPTGQLPFRINPHTGVVVTTAPLDRERSQSFAFTVTATDQAPSPSNQKHASVTAQVFLLDVNDNIPAFVSLETAHVVEDAEAGTLVHHVMAKDGDEGSNGEIMYRLLSGNESGLFTIEERTGLLYLSGSLDYESQNVHTLVVEASDNGHPSLSSTQTLSVVVMDVNDQPPVFQFSVYNASVGENKEPGEPVIKLTAGDLDSEENAALTYSLLPGPGYDLFTIDSHTGQISTFTQLDRELHRSFILRVQAQDSGFPSLSSTVTVQCSVLDDNDNTPEFSQPSFHVVIPENLPPGLIHTAQASDPDNGPNGTVIYSIQGEGADGYFAIDAVTGTISATRSLDREERSNYTLKITASDQGSPPLSSTTLLHLTLSDVNDNSPSFARKSYRVSVSEGLPAGSEILRLFARDPDEGSNGEVVYSLSEETSGIFSVNSSTGVLSLSRPLDRESRSQHTFRAVATDGCRQGPRSSVVAVTVQVEDVNDNPPSCPGEPVRASVSAATARPRRTVVTVTAEDPDQGENGTVTFGLMEEDELFEIDGSSGDVRLKTRLDDGVSGTKLLRVWAADQGRPALTSNCLVFIHLNGEELGLQFTENLYEVSIPENSKTGSWVANVVAHDQTSDGETISYSIFSGNENGAFSINSRTGDITVRDQSLLDFEAQRKVHLVVLAENGQQTAHARLAVTLQDVNDNTPVFKQSYYRTAVWEGQLHNTYIMQVFATDSDSGVNGQIEYSIVSGNHNNAFIIDSVRGILATNAVLDREIIPSYKLVLQAKDRGSPPLTGTSTVRVQVVDINDNSPAIPPMEPVPVAENLPVGYTVTQVTANDVDLSPSLTYSFAGMGDTNGSFTIDRYTGVISLTRSLDHEASELHTLTVQASDSVHQTEAPLTIHVLDVNDNAPIFTKESYQVVLSELTPSDTSVVTVSATDEDSGLNGKISYRLLSSPLRGFYIDSETGSVFTNKPLKHIANGNTVRLLVEARDSGDPVLSSVTSVDITVVDANDHSPVFEQSSYQLSVSEDAPVGSTLLTLLAEDRDYSGQNTQLDYAITRGNEQRQFCMESVSIQTDTQQRTLGRIVLCDSLDRETMETYVLTVTVRDRGVPPLNSSTLVSLTVLDVNDNAPSFSSSEYHMQVRENSPPGTPLIQVLAHDPDKGANGTVRYDIISGNSKGRLRLDRQTGALEVSSTLDYEEDTKYTLTIQASDGDGPVNRNVAFAVVFISVLDENDNSPFFVFPTVNCSVLENQPAFTPVCSVHAVDNDAGTYGLLTYSITSSCFMDYGSGNPDRKEAFAIDPLTGDIHTRQTFDYERESEYCFVVEARDQGDQVATVKVQIDIDGVDEFSPVFTQQQYHFLLPENAMVGQSVGQVLALDHDGGLDGVVEYTLVAPSPFFNIGKTTGSLYISDRVYRTKGNQASEGTEELFVMASSPKLDSKYTTCQVVVNITYSGEALGSVALRVHTVSLSISLIVFFLLLISCIGLVLRYKAKEVALMKAASLAANLNNGTSSFGRTGSYQPNSINLQDLQIPLDLRAKRDTSNLFRNSDSSGRGSAEGETAEDQEIEMINEYPFHRQSGTAPTEPVPRAPDSTIPKDSEYISRRTEPEEPVSDASLGACLAAAMASSESLHNFKDEGGGEGMLPRMVSIRDVDDAVTGCMPPSDHQGSLTSLLCQEEQLRGSYEWEYLLNWEPRFQPLATVFTDIAMLPGEGDGVKDMDPELQSLMHPPPLITAVAQPGIRAVPPRMPPKVPTLGRRPSYPRYTYSPLPRNTGLTPSAMTPSFSPSLSVLTLRTPSASPVVSETGLGCYTKMTSLPSDILTDGEIQV
ncbi:LOW QUALITY PROTEIN: protocadherin-23 [Chanos chanos]|uniref:Protocadherin-16 n=1 Tax=Chanos chanos TaxID=29144 RepID=A0A6J2WIF5_CHACN|nr:LOW QUALITY PROTEIN: protocadherin-23 [Chanos chanos]